MKPGSRNFVGSQDYFDGTPVDREVHDLCARSMVVHYHGRGRHRGWAVVVEADSAFVVAHSSRGVLSWHASMSTALRAERELLLETGRSGSPGSKFWNNQLRHRELLRMIAGPEAADPLDVFRGADISLGVDRGIDGVQVNGAKYAWNWDGTLTHPTEVAPRGPNEATVELLMDGLSGDALVEDGPPRIYQWNDWYWVESDESEWVLLPRGFRSVEDARWYAGRVRQRR